MSNLNEFMLKEYESIVTAHFEVSRRVTVFFQISLLVYSAPLLFVSNSVSTFIGLDHISRGVISIAIVLVGISIFSYISLLRIESLLYARTVNGIRKYFYDQSLLNIESISHYSVLPLQKNKPPYFATLQFLWIAVAYGILNSLFLLLGIFSLRNINFTDLCTNQIRAEILPFLPIAILLIFFHLALYFFLSNYQEKGRDFYRQTIGVDIDGVLNKHEAQFCKILHRLHEGTKGIKESDIDYLPVHESPTLQEQVTAKMEKEVFEYIDYWNGLEVVESCHLLNKLRTESGYKVILFTDRNPKKIPKSLEQKHSGTKSLKKITVEWLRRHGIEWDKLFMLSDHRCGIRRTDRRYTITKNKKIEFFVEDNYYNAVKLSTICRVVFLIAHKYNSPSVFPVEGSKNIVRVSDWSEIYRYITKQLS